MQFAWCPPFLAVPPPELSRHESLTVVVATVVVALTRWLALSRTLWDWDEALFSLGLRQYDVTLHHPHPPGFPLFIATARLFRLAGFSEFHSLQAVSFLGAMTIVPATFFLARELRMAFEPALASALLLAFFPNVWFFGGTAFSDVPSMTLVMVAVALLLRGCRDFESFLAGAMVLGIAAGYRPQNLLIGFVPSLLAAVCQLRRHWLRPLAALVMIVGIVASAYAAAAALSGGWEGYRNTLKAHQEYITKVDSFRSPTRPSLPRLFDDFFIRPYHAKIINAIVSVLVAVSFVMCFVRPRAPIVITLLSFGPFAVLAWLLLDWLSVSRFSIGYAPMMAILAADGMSILGRRAARISLAATLLIAVIWTWPALQEVRRNPSPPVAAAEWIRKNVARSTHLYVHGSMHPLAEALLADFSMEEVNGESPPAVTVGNQHSVFVREGAVTGSDVRLFTRPRQRLVHLVRNRYFEVSVVPVTEVVDFREGWHEPEGNGTAVWHWMKQRGVVILPPIHGEAKLSLQMYVPLDALRVPPTITVSLNGKQIDQFRATTSTVGRDYVVPAQGTTGNELVIATDRIVNPAAQHLSGDSRDLGLRLDSLGWVPAK